MRINSISTFQNHSQAKTSANRSFGARIGLHNTVIPYLKAQGTYMAFAKGESAAQNWATATWANIQKIGERFKSVLNPDTPIVMAVKDDAIQHYLMKKGKMFDGIDGMLVMDGKPMFLPPEILPEVTRCTEPVYFKFGPDASLADKLADTFNKIPKEIASLFKAQF